MKDRIAHVIRAKGLTAAEFALRLGIQPSNISHLLSGRNNPSLDFVKKLKETFPEYNLDWLIFGKGPMTVSEPFLERPHLAEKQLVEIQDESESSDAFRGTPLELMLDSKAETPVDEAISKTALTSIILVYEDHSFQILSPKS